MITLRTFASGDTDYIAKLNANVEAIKAAIDALQLQAGGASGVNEITVGSFWASLFNNADCLIGPGSYVPTQNATSVTVSAGGFYLAGTQTPVSRLTTAILSFVGQTGGTKYIVIDGSGAPTLSDTQDAGTAYSVVWSGSAFIGEPVRVAACLFDASEATASRESTTLGDLLSPPADVVYDTLDDRLEAIEVIAVDAKNNADTAIETLYEAGLLGATKVRKIGITVDDAAGMKGAIQVDFAGTLIGWSCIADGVGDLVVSVSKKASSPPPSDPSIPDPVLDLISYMDPIMLSSQQSAAEDDLSGWSDVHVYMWDVIQFTVDTPATVSSATLYLRIQED